MQINSKERTTAIILAAGKGTRFGSSDVNKTAISIGGKSIIQIGIDKIKDLVDDTVVVVGHKKESVINSITTKGIRYVIQSKRLGTGHAVKIALNEIIRQKKNPSHVLVANGDHLFMIDKPAVQKLLQNHKAETNDVTILTALHNSPEKLDNGRIIRRGDKAVSILEKSEFKNGENKIRELNTGTYAFKFDSLAKSILGKRSERGKELFITKILFYLPKVGTVTVPFGSVGTGINTKEDLNNTQGKVL
jgi:bifunctional UDP-N-acetylglucosamine pyrophosphorylase/glucosamine-1-phosphate N-acetyltransferase